MTTGESCSARLTGSTRLPRRTYDGSLTRSLCRITGRWGLSSSPAGRRERAQGRKEVDSEARTFFLLRVCYRPVHRRQRQCEAMGADADLAADTGPQTAGVSSAAAEARRVAEWHGGFSAGRPRVA